MRIITKISIVFALLIGVLVYQHLQIRQIQLELHNVELIITEG